MRVLDVEGLTVCLSDHKKEKIIRDLSFSLEEGQILGIAGESGAGKSMTAKAIFGILPDGVEVVSGTVRWNEACPGMIFQNAKESLNPVLKIGTQLIETIRYRNTSDVQTRAQKKEGYAKKICRREAEDQAEELLRQVGMPQPEIRMHQYPCQLSGGLAQRAAIALTLAGCPDVLVADEPTSSLDEDVQQSILNLLFQMTKEKMKALVLITHDLSVVEKYCSHVMIMYHGEMIESGTVEEVFREPRAAYTKELLESARILGAIHD